MLNKARVLIVAFVIAVFAAIAVAPAMAIPPGPGDKQCVPGQNSQPGPGQKGGTCPGNARHQIRPR